MQNSKKKIIRNEERYAKHKLLAKIKITNKLLNKWKNKMKQKKGVENSKLKWQNCCRLAVKEKINEKQNGNISNIL